MEPGKKISFGFSKSSKKVPVIQNKLEVKKVELVECFEDQSIKIKDAVEIFDEPLIIPLRGNKRNLSDRVREAKESKDKELEDDRPDSELTLDELAARELINDAKRRLLERKPENKVHVLPLKEESLSLEGEKESTLEDYEKIPVSDYGLAVLRGMGWKDGMGIGKRAAKVKVSDAPELRPKGLGLGANKMVKSELPNDSACDDEGRVLILKRGTFAKIIAGNHKGSYCEVQGLDDESCRVIVRTSLKGEILTLNEFLVVPVTKEEYSKYSKSLNNAKYEEYKNKEEHAVKIEVKSETSGHYSRKDDTEDKYSRYSKSSSNDKYEGYRDKEEHKVEKEIKPETSGHYSRKDHDTEDKYSKNSKSSSDDKYKGYRDKEDHKVRKENKSETSRRYSKKHHKRREHKKKKDKR